MKTAIALPSVQNPFRLARLRAELSAVKTVETLSRADWDENTREFVRLTAPQSISKGLQMLAMGLQAEISHECAKPRAVRFHASTSRGQDDGWRIWVVLNREVSANILAHCESVAMPDSEAVWGEPTALERACAELWAEWGFDPSATPQSDYSPTGQMFARSLWVKVARNGCIILSQSGARDV